MSKSLKSLTYTDLGHPGSSHYKTGELAVDANYISRDIGSRPIELTFTLMGYEMTENEAILILNSLSQYLNDVRKHKDYLAGEIPVKAN